MIEVGRFDRLALETLIDGRLITRQLLREVFSLNYFSVFIQTITVWKGLFGL